MVRLVVAVVVFTFDERLERRGGKLMGVEITTLTAAPV